jgi:hypothetical protein
MTATALRIPTLLLVLAASACDGEAPTGSTPPAQQPKPVATVQLSPDRTVIVEGWMRQMEMELFAADGTSLGARPALWSSSDTTVAVVSAEGAVRARRAGTAVVTAQVEGRTGQATVEVEARRATRLSLSHHTLGLGFLQSAQVGATAAAQDGGYIDAKVTWTTSDSTVVAVDSTGRVTARSAGTASVKARVGDVVAEVYVSAAGPVLAGNWRLIVRDVENGETACSVDGVSVRAIVNGMQVSGGTESWSSPVVSCADLAAPSGAMQGLIQRTTVSLAIGAWMLDGTFTTADRIEGTARYYEDPMGFSVRTGRFLLVRE